MAIKKYTWLWIAWALAFIGIEWSALANDKRGDTLSERVWGLLGTFSSKPNAWQWAARGGLVVGFGWLVPHFLLGWW